LRISKRPQRNPSYFLLGTGLLIVIEFAVFDMMTGLFELDAFALAAGFNWIGEVVLALASAGTAAFALASGAAEFALASGAAVFEFVSAGASPAVLSTETLPVKAGIARNSADIINVAAATIVIFDKTVAVPRGANAELETLLVSSAPASVLPGCSKTEATSTTHERKNNPYKK